MTVADAKGRRWDAATGIGFAIFSIVGLALPGTPPKADDPTSKIASFLGDHRKEVLVGNFLFGIAAIFFIWWVGTLRSYLRSGEGGEGRLSAAAFGGGIAGVVLLLAGASLFNGVAFELIKGQRASPELVRAIFDAASGVIAMASERRAPAVGVLVGECRCGHPGRRGPGALRHERSLRHGWRGPGIRGARGRAPLGRRSERADDDAPRGAAGSPGRALTARRLGSPPCGT